MKFQMNIQYKDFGTEQTILFDCIQTELQTAIKETVTMMNDLAKDDSIQDITAQVQLKQDSIVLADIKDLGLFIGYRLDDLKHEKKLKQSPQTKQKMGIA